MSMPFGIGGIRNELLREIDEVDLFFLTIRPLLAFTGFCRFQAPIMHDSKSRDKPLVRRSPLFPLLLVMVIAAIVQPFAVHAADNEYEEVSCVGDGMGFTTFF